MCCSYCKKAFNRNRYLFTKLKIKNQDIRLTKDWAYVLGTLCGDGSIRREDMELSVIDKEFAQTFKQALERITGSRIKMKYSTHKKQYRVIYHYKPLCDYMLERYGSFKTKEWKIPKEILMTKKSIQKCFIQAMIDSEGCCQIKKNNVNISITSTNLPQLRKLKKMIEEFEIKPYIIAYPHRADIYISDKENLKRFKREFGFTIKRKQRLLEKGLKMYTNNNPFNRRWKTKEEGQRIIVEFLKRNKRAGVEELKRKLRCQFYCYFPSIIKLKKKLKIKG